MQGLRSQWGDAPWERPLFRGGERTSLATPDVAIVGGGLTGVSTAYHLARMGMRPVLFEAGFIADGASGRTGGLVLEGTAAGILNQVDACVPKLKRVVDEEQIDCGLALPGCWELQHSNSASEVMLPWSDGDRPVGIAKTVSGGVVQPAALAIGIAHAATKLGAIICEHSRVTEIELASELVLRVGNERITPGRIVVATNAWINATLSDVPPLHSSLTFACVTQKLDRAAISAIGLSEGVPFYTSDLPYLWGRTTLEGRAIFGSGLKFGGPAELEGANVRSDDSEAMLHRLRTRVRGLHPALHHARFETSWGGPIAFTEDSIPLLGAHPRNPRLLVSGAYAGHGIALSVRAGELVAMSIANNVRLPDWGSLLR